MKKCSNCQSLNRLLANFCKRCGMLLVDRCPRCQITIGDESDFCDNCGLALAPRAQFSWIQGSSWSSDRSVHESSQIISDDHPSLHVGHSIPGQSADVAGPRSPPEHFDGSPSRERLDSLQRFIPQELANKIRAARVQGEMVGERRVVTMLFCDIQGSTAAAEQLDPEEWTEIINGAFEHMIRPVYKYEGTVARLMGDGILAFFGAPIAHEDDPQRAILAGLDIVAGFKSYQRSIDQRYGINIEVRVGINTGMVVVGTVGSDLRMEYTAMGDAINLAARMEQTAAPGTVQVAEDTYRLVAPLFEFEDLKSIEVKGKEKPVPAFRVLGRKAVPGRLRGIEGLEAPLIGRKSEWSQLVKAAEGVRKGVGQIVFLIGEAGLGKSRLIQELYSENWDRALGIGDQKSAIQVNSLWVDNEEIITELKSPETNSDPQPPNPDPQWYETVSLSYESAQPYSLIQRLAQNMCDIKPNDPSESVRNKLATLVGTLPQDNQSQFRQVFESLFGLNSLDGRPPLEGESFKGQLYVVTEALWRHQASISPIVLVCDDLHWADSASIDLLKHLFKLCNELPILFICALRPDRYAPGWKLTQVATDLYAHRTIELNLRPLTAEDSNKLIDSLLTIADLPVSLRENIMAKSEGNPFFVEEVIRTLIDAGDVVRDESGAHWVARKDGSGVEIPENLQALLTTRIDQLEEQPRQVLQIASLIGRNFYYRVLERVLAIQTPGGNGQGPALSGELNEHLTTLQYADLIREVARIPELEYIFRHGLTQEAAYRTILLKLRREYHRIVGEVIEELFVDHLEEHAATLALHFKEASDEVRAVRYYTLAGDVAFRLFALSEAIEHYSQALTLIDPLTADKDELIHLFLRRGRAYELINSYDDVLEGYAELERVATDREDDTLKMAALLARTIVHSTFSPVFDPKLGLPLAEEAIALARKLDDFAAETKILWSLMLVHAFALGDLDAGASYGQQALALARRHQLTEQLPYILNDLGRIMGFNGQIREGLPLIAEAQPLFEESGNLPLLCDNLSGYSGMNFFSGNLELSKDAALEGLRIARSINNRFGIDDGIFRLSAVHAEHGKFGRALEGWESVISKSEAVQHEIMILPALSYIYVELDAASAIPARFEAVRDQVDVAGPIFRIMFLAELTRLYIYLEELSEAKNIWRELDLDIKQEKLIPLKMSVFLAYAELLFARQQFEQALAFLERMTAEQEAMGCFWYWGDAVLLWAKALLLVNPPQPEKARAVLENACVRTREMGNKRVLWKTLLALANLLEEDEADPLRREAQEIVTVIADSIEDPDLRQSFLNRPEIASNLSVHQ